LTDSTLASDDRVIAATVASPLQAARPRSAVRSLLRVIGPAWIVMLADVDAPSVLTAAKAGTDFGYAILLPIIGLIPVLYLVQEMTARLAIGTGLGHAELIRERYGFRGGAIPVASMVAAAEAIVKSGAKLRGDLIITAVADEETGSAKGTRHLIERGLKANMAVVSEPTDLRIEIAHKGILWAEITTKGKGSHASRPHLGVNAIDKMNAIINALHEIKLEGYNQLFDVPQPVLSVTTITGGTKINVIPDLCKIEIDRRLLPGETPEFALGQIKDATAKVKAKDPTLEATVKVQEEWPAMEVAPEEKIVQTLAHVVEARTGAKPKFFGKAAGTDASWLVRDAKIPTVLYGPGDPRFSHTPDEHVELNKVTEAARVFAVLAGEVLGVE